MLSKNKMRYIDLADKVSRLSNYRVKVGAVIVKNGKVVGVGFNKTFGYDKLIKYAGKVVRSIHAELMAILHADTDLEGAEIFVVSRKKDGKYRLSKPCSVCMAVIIEKGIKRVYFTTNEQDIRVIDLRKFNQAE